MLRHSSQLQAATKQAYICGACRRHRHLAQASQRRWNSQQVQTVATTSDSWFDTINDINDEYGQSPRNTKSASQPQDDVDQRQSKIRRERLQASRMGITGGIDPDLEMLKKSLSTTLGRSETGEPNAGAGADGKPSSKDAGFKAAFLSGKSQHRDINTESATKAHAASRTVEKKLSDDDILKNLLGELQHNRNLKAGEQDGGFEEGRDETENGGTGDQIEAAQQDTSPASFPIFQGLTIPREVDSVRVPAGKTVAAEPNQEHTTFKTWRAKTSPSDSGLGGLVLDRGIARKTKSLWTRYGDTQARQPWGASTPQGTSTAAKATFDSLAKADRISSQKHEKGVAAGKPAFGLLNSVKTVWRSIPSAVKQEDVQNSPLQAGGPLSDLDQAGAMDHLRTQLLERMDRPGSEASETAQVDLAPTETEKVSSRETRAMESLSKLHSKATGEDDTPDPSNKQLQNPDGVATQLRRDEECKLHALKQARKRAKGQSSECRRTRVKTTKCRARLRASRPAKNRLHASVEAYSDQNREIEGTSLGPSDINAESLCKSSSGVETSQDGTVKQLAAEAQASIPAVGVNEGRQDQANDNAHVDILAVNPANLKFQPLDIPQPPVPYLEYGLDRVLFNPAVYQLQDATSRVYNFDPYLQKIMPVEQFDFNALKEYKTSSQDTALAAIARQHKSRYIGSTSSMTSSLAHFHYLISNWRPLNLEMLSHGYVGRYTSSQFTKINKAPSAIFLRWKNGCYAIDADKEFDSANVLMLLGKSMELLLTLPKDEYEKYRKSDPRTVSDQQRFAPESYQYSTLGDFLMRSQLDAYDPRLPGNGTFDLKTRAVVTVRMSAHDHERMTGYEIYGSQGRWGSYEKEYHDMARATMLKYLLQARMGRMNGIFVAYHNVKRMFGFQYIPISEMDRVLHGQTDPSLGDQEFKASLRIMNDLLDRAVAKFPEQSLRIHFETQAGSKDMPTYLHMFAEPMSESEIDVLQEKPKAKIAEYERKIMGREESVGAGEDAITESAECSSGPGSQSEDATAYARQQLDLRSTDAPADKPFLHGAQEMQTSHLKPLFYATVIVQSKVNDAIPQDDRPHDLKPSDEWSLEYLIKEYEVTQRHWALYDDMRARRRQALHFEREEADEADGEAEGNRKSDDGYIEFLKDLSKKGDELRQKQDLADLEGGQPVVRVDDALPRHREKIETLEDYIAWMYRREQA